MRSSLTFRIRKNIIGDESFKKEYLGLLRKFDIAFEDKYVFDFIE